MKRPHGPSLTPTNATTCNNTPQACRSHIKPNTIPLLFEVPLNRSRRANLTDLSRQHERAILQESMPPCILRTIQASILYKHQVFMMVHDRLFRILIRPHIYEALIISPRVETLLKSPCDLQLIIADNKTSHCQMNLSHLAGHDILGDVLTGVLRRR